MNERYLRKIIPALLLMLVVCIGMAAEPVVTFVTIATGGESEKSDFKEEKDEKKACQLKTESRLVSHIQIFPNSSGADYISATNHFNPQTHFKGNRTYVIPLLRAPPASI